MEVFAVSRISTGNQLSLQRARPRGVKLGARATEGGWSADSTIRKLPEGKPSLGKKKIRDVICGSLVISSSLSLAPCFSAPGSSG